MKAQSRLPLGIFLLETLCMVSGHIIFSNASYVMGGHSS